MRRKITKIVKQKRKRPKTKNKIDILKMITFLISSFFFFLFCLKDCSRGKSSIKSQEYYETKTRLELRWRMW
jgi:hypothetical protein